MNVSLPIRSALLQLRSNGDASAYDILSGGVLISPIWSLTTLFLLSLSLYCIYNIYFHPLRDYPGPKSAAATGLVYWYFSLNGELVRWTARMHAEHGEIVRLAPDRLSYVNPQAWKDIYGHRTGGRKENSKDPQFFMPEPGKQASVLATIDHTEHSRTRKIFTNAFSERALRLHVPMMRKYILQLMSNLADHQGAPVDMVKMYNYATFDIMADLTFGESLGLLDNAKFAPWVEAVFANMKAWEVNRFTQHYPPLDRISRLLTPKAVLKQVQEHFQHSVDRVNKRIERGSDRPDIWGLVLEKGEHLSAGEMHANAALFMVAGTETSATTLSGLTYLLLKNPDKMQKVVEEVRALRSEEELTLETVSRLRYLDACLEEGLRLYPAAPNTLPRKVPDGGNVICGKWVPGGIRVGVAQQAAYHSPLNFRDPESFVPERWLPDGGYHDDRKEVFQPFSFGPRNCLGKNLAYHQIRLIMAHMLWNFDMQLCPQSDKWMEQKSFLLWEKPELLVKLSLVQR